MSNPSVMGTPSVRQLDPAELTSAEDMPRRTYKVLLQDSFSTTVTAHQNSIVTSGALLFTDFDMVDQYGRGHSPRLVRAFGAERWVEVGILDSD